MANVLWKIPIRKAIREKGKSICVIAAIFFTTVLFVTVFSTLFFVLDAAEEMMRESSFILADASFLTTKEEYERISKNPLVAEAGMGIRIGSMMEPSGVGELLLFDLDEKMAQWMRYAPQKGRMPQTGNEIAVSDQFLRECGLTYEADMRVTLTYFIGEQEFTDIFTVVGIYERVMQQPYHAVLTSDDFYREACRQLEGCGIKPEDVTYRLAGVMFASRGNVRRLVSLLSEEEGLAFEEGQIFLNDTSLLDNLSIGVWAALACLVVFVMVIGYLFISNIFQISITRDARFYGKLTTNGVTKKEIKGLIRRENNFLFLIASIPALLAGYIFSAAILPGMLSAYTTIQIKRNGNLMIFILSLVFSYATVLVSERKPAKLAKNASPIEMKKYVGRYRRVKAADGGDCLKKFVTRHFMSDKKKVLKVCVSIALGILLANVFYALAAGFDEEEYVKENLDADYLIAKESIFVSPNVNLVSYERTAEEEIAEYLALTGIRAAGGAAVSQVCLAPSEEEWDAFVAVAGEDTYSTPGEMWTTAYGLDDIMVERLKPIDGEIDLELFHTGKYVLLDPIMSTNDDNVKNVACYRPGDEVTIPFRSGEMGTYTVMAIVEGLPSSLSFPGRWYASDLYLPMAEWQEKEKRDDYYIYAFDVEEECHDIWDDTLESRLGGENGALAYRSAKTEAAAAEGYITGLKLAGFVLSMILLSMGILNFTNCTAGDIYARRKELAILQSMGVEESEIRRVLTGEGMLYMAGGFVPGVLLAVPGVYVLIEKLLMEPYITYQVYPGIYLLVAILGGVLAFLTPQIAYRMMDRRENFLQRIRACRE